VSLEIVLEQIDVRRRTPSHSIHAKGEQNERDTTECKDPVDPENGTTYAYRQCGKEAGTPLALLTHFRGTVDTWDPPFINSLAASRTVILFDNVGIVNRQVQSRTLSKAWQTMHSNSSRRLQCRRSTSWASQSILSPPFGASRSVAWMTVSISGGYSFCSAMGGNTRIRR
jgi:hypothetical protein